MSARHAALALAMIACLATPAAGALAPELAPYAAFARGAGAQHLLAVAREGVRAGLGEPDSLQPRVPDRAPDWPGAPRPVFVILAAGRVTRACLGTDAPLGTLAETVRELAARLPASDSRHPPIGIDELPGLRLMVAFAGEGTAIADPYAVDPLREGLRIETDTGSIVFLPGEARTVAWALSEARRTGVLRGRLADARFTRFPAVVIQGPAAAAVAAAPETSP